MKSWIAGAILSGGMVLAQSAPAGAQVTYSLGRPANSPSVTIGQPSGVYDSRYYGQPGYYRQPGYDRAPGTYANRPAQPYPSTTYYGSGYRGYAPAPGYYSNTGYGYAPAPYPGAPGTGNPVGQGVYLNLPNVGPVRVR
jgi:hypothetical protein